MSSRARSRVARRPFEVVARRLNLRVRRDRREAERMVADGWVIVSSTPARWFASGSVVFQRVDPAWAELAREVAARRARGVPWEPLASWLRVPVAEARARFGVPTD